jgi:RNA polymerase sigma-70 factor (ECF subfamily)
MEPKEKNIQKLAETFIVEKTEKSFKNLFDRLRPGILNHCFLILKEQELAEDAFLNTMGKIWTKIEQYNDDRGNFSTWCYNIARNESLLLMKSRKKYNNRTDLEIEFLSERNTIGDMGGIYTMEEDHSYAFGAEEDSLDSVYEHVLNEIRELPDLYRDIMIDREIHNMKYKDIAEKYGIKKRSIATRIRRARNKIKKIMEDRIDTSNRTSKKIIKENVKTI